MPPLTRETKVARMNAKGQRLCNKLCRSSRNKMKRFASKAARRAKDSE